MTEEDSGSQGVGEDVDVQQQVAWELINGKTLDLQMDGGANNGSVGLKHKFKTKGDKRRGCINDRQASS